MITYNSKFNKHGEIFSFECAEFPGLIGFGKTALDANKDFYSKFHIELNERIKNCKPIPLTKIVNDTKIKTEQWGTFILPISVELTVRLHEILLAKKVSGRQLANLLALTDNDIKPNDWELNKILKVKPLTPPKYKKVQRLLNVLHPSTIDEMSEAFRVLDCLIDLDVVSKK